MPPQLSRTVRVLAWLAGAALLAVAAHAACGQPGDQNLVSNCGFDGGTTAGYTAAQGVCNYSGAAGSSQIGSMLCDAASDGFGGFRFVVKHCITSGLQLLTDYGLAVDARYASGPNVATCIIGTADTDAVNCDSLTASHFSAPWSPAATSFLQSPPIVHTTGLTVNAAIVQVTCSVSSPGQDFTIYLDDFFFGEPPVPLFANGFESGNTGGWSSAVP